jgi:hypothetical protein
VWLVSCFERGNDAFVLSLDNFVMEVGVLARPGGEWGWGGCLYINYNGK